jgi:hypothetical protein
MYKEIYNYMHTLFCFMPGINQNRLSQMKYINKIASIEIPFTVEKK